MAYDLDREIKIHPSFSTAAGVFKIKIPIFLDILELNDSVDSISLSS